MFDVQRRRITGLRAVCARAQRQAELARLRNLGKAVWGSVCRQCVPSDGGGLGPRVTGFELHPATLEIY